jgi:peptidoglycan/LPS O-acetylase OafA/YrhL
VVDVHRLIFHVSLCAWLGACVVRRDHFQRRLLDHRYLQLIGRCSYGLYLTHFIAIGSVRLFIDPSHNVLVFLATLPLALLIAQLSLHVVEQPFFRYKARFASGTT